MALKSFRDRNPYAIGIASVLVIGAFIGAAFMIGILHVLEHTYSVRAEFSDAAGIRGGDNVRIAGVKAGRVKAIKADRRNGRVIVELEVNQGVKLSADQTRAEVALETLLGTKYIRLSGPVHAPYLEDEAKARRVIPIDRTKTPFDVFQLTTVGARKVEATDTEKLNQFITQLADITQGNGDDIRTLLSSVADVSAAINQRDTQVQQLIDRFDKLSKLLADKDQTLVGLLDQSQAVLELVARRRDDIGRGLAGGEQVANELARLVEANQARLDAVLSNLHPTLATVQKHESDIDRALAFLGPGSLGLARSTAHGPWADVYVRAVGPDVLQVINDVLTSKVAK